MLALLMDIRDEIQQINRLIHFHCENFLTIHNLLDKIQRNTKKRGNTKKRAKIQEIVADTLNAQDDEKAAPRICHECKHNRPTNIIDCGRFETLTTYAMMGPCGRGRSAFEPKESQT
jgi:hypothetical protein